MCVCEQAAGEITAMGGSAGASLETTHGGVVFTRVNEEEGSLMRKRDSRSFFRWLSPSVRAQKSGLKEGDLGDRVSITGSESEAWCSGG